ncbi:MAG: ATP-binding protein, partial [Mariprofundales bacterium]
LHRRYSDQLDDSAKEFIGFAVDGTNRMQQMINDLLNYSRIGSQSKPLEPLALQPLIDNAIANLKLTIDESDTVITMDPCDTIIMADSSQMVRLFQNLIGNAIKFQPENQRAQITITINDELPCITITISDNGLGIPSAYRAMVFDVFKRLHGRDKYSGSGIGLSVCNRIVAHHHGTLTIADQPEGQPGSTFVITLPQAEPTISAEKESNQ